METKQFTGFLKEGCYGEADDIVLLNGEPLAELLEDEGIHKKLINVTYYISDKEMTLEEAQLISVISITGLAKVDYEAHYSEYTGYLWTDEEFIVGGHDLLEELRTYSGKYLILNIEVHDEK